MMFKKCQPPRLAVRVLLVLGFGLLTFKLYRYTVHDPLQQSARDAFLALIPDDLASKPVTDERTCNCSQNRTTYTSAMPELQLETPLTFSSCDNYSTWRGPHQWVVSYAFYGPSATGFMKGIEENAQRVAEVYAGWTMRVYHSADTSKTAELEMLCSLWCRYPHLDFCQVGRLPPPLGDVSHANGMVWRFLVLGDSLVDRFIIRDVDSIPYQREVDAVQDWIRSNTSWHFMHDNPVHNTIILGGMWGGTNRNLQETTAMRHNLLADGNNYYMKGADQELLAKHLWSRVQHTGDFVRHASFLCKKLPGSVPFPSQRQNGEFVGAPVLIYENQTISKECPEECRPKDHLDWIHC